MNDAAQAVARAAKAAKATRGSGPPDGTKPCATVAARCVPTPGRPGTVELSHTAVQNILGRAA